MIRLVRKHKVKEKDLIFVLFHNLFVSISFQITLTTIGNQKL